MRLDMGPVEIDEDIADQIKGLKPTYGERLPAKLLPLLPLIEERLCNGVSVATLAKLFKKKQSTFYQALNSARKKRDRLNAANGQPPAPAQDTRPADAVTAQPMAQPTASPSATPQAAQVVPPPAKAGAATAVPKPEPAAQADGQSEGGQPEEGQPAEAKPLSKREQFEATLKKVPADWPFEQMGNYPGSVKLSDGSWAMLPMGMSDMQFVSICIKYDDEESDERKYGELRRVGEAFDRKMKEKKEREKAAAEAAEAERTAAAAAPDGGGDGGQGEAEG